MKPQEIANAQKSICKQLVQSGKFSRLALPKSQLDWQPVGVLAVLSITQPGLQNEQSFLLQLTKTFRFNTNLLTGRQVF